MRSLKRYFGGRRSSYRLVTRRGVFLLFFIATPYPNLARFAVESSSLKHGMDGVEPLKC